MSESLADTIEPKSDQLNADDLISGPITVTITAVKRAPNSDQPIDVHIEGHRPYRPCKSMRRVLISLYGDKGAAWVGQSLTLYRDPEVKYGGVAVGGIRISHATGIDRRHEILLTTSRSKRSKYFIEPLHIAPDPGNVELFGEPPQLSDIDGHGNLVEPATRYDDLIFKLGNCESAGEFQALVSEAKVLYLNLSNEQQKTLADMIAAKKGELSNA